MLPQGGVVVVLIGAVWSAFGSTHGADRIAAAQVFSSLDVHLGPSALTVRVDSVRGGAHGGSLHVTVWRGRPRAPARSVSQEPADPTAS